MQNKFRTGLAGRRLINARLRASGQEPAPGKQYAGVKRIARWLKRVEFGDPPLPPAFARQMRYMNRGARERYSAEVEAMYDN